MVEERITDGRRIAELLASEVDGRADNGLDRLHVTNAEPDVEPTADGARAYDIEWTADGELLARVFVHDDRIRIEFETGQEPALEAAESRNLTVRPRAQPPRTLVFVDSGAAVKRATDVIVVASRERTATGDE